MTISESEVRKCPKRGGEMVEGRYLIARYMLLAMSITFAKEGDVFGDISLLFAIRTVATLNYIELYKEKKE